MKIVSAAEHARIAKMLRVGWIAPEGVAEIVAEILADVLARGDAALIECARRFDDDRFDISILAFIGIVSDGSGRHRVDRDDLRVKCQIRERRRAHCRPGLRVRR